MKKTISTCSIVTMLMCSLFLPTAFAEKQDDNDDEETIEIFDEIGELRKEGKLEKDEIEGMIEKSDWTVVEHKRIIVDKNGKEIEVEDGDFSVNYVDPGYFTIDLWINAHDRYRDRWTAFADWEWSDWELYPASFDVLSFNWDPDLLKYVSRKPTDEESVWIMSAEERDNGTLLFNVRDRVSLVDKNRTGSYYVNLRQVDYPNPDEFTSVSVKYTHTYDTTQKSTEFSGEAGIDWGTGGTIGVSYRVISTTVEKNWSKSALSDAFDLH